MTTQKNAKNVLLRFETCCLRRALLSDLFLRKQESLKLASLLDSLSLLEFFNTQINKPTKK